MGHFLIFLEGVAVGLARVVLRGLGGDHLIERALLGLPFEPSGVVIAILAITFLLGFFN